MELEVINVTVRKVERRPYDHRPTPKTRLYFHLDSKSTSPTGGTTLMDAIHNRRTQPSRVFRTLIPQVLAKVRAALPTSADVESFDARTVGLDAKVEPVCGLLLPLLTGLCFEQRVRLQYMGGC